MSLIPISFGGLMELIRPTVKNNKKQQLKV